jgi:hypothetical protein
MNPFVKNTLGVLVMDIVLVVLIVGIPLVGKLLSH